MAKKNRSSHRSSSTSKVGREYLVRVTDTKQGQQVGNGPILVRATGPTEAKREAILEATRRNLVIDPSRLHAHAPQRAGDKYGK